MKGRVPLEKVEQEHGLYLLRTIGAQVWVTGIPRRRGDYQGAMRTPGLPDVLCFLPPREGSRRLLFWEVKRASGKLRPEQAFFRDQVFALGFPGVVAHVTGPFDALLAYLVEGGYILPSSLAHYRLASRQVS